MTLTCGRWMGLKVFGLEINRSWVQFPPGQSCITAFGKLFTPMCLCHQAV